MSLVHSYHFEPDGMVPGNRTEIWVDGPIAFPEILGEIDRALDRIALETYQFSADETGRSIAKALAGAVLRGVEVRVIYDCVGSLETPESFFSDLRDRGVLVEGYHPFRPWRPRWSLFRRDHRKMFISDDRIVAVGGFNIGNAYRKSPVEGGIHDVALAVRGPVVGQAWDLFEKTWSYLRDKKRRKSKARKVSDSRFSEGVPVQIVGNDAFLDRFRIRRNMIYAIRQATATVDIMNPYFLPSSTLIMGLKKAVRRGVRVRVVVPKGSDVPLIDLASTVVQHRLSKAGIEVYLWPGFAHGKIVAVDGRWLSVGSYNFDYQSLFRNLEVVAQSVDESTGSDIKGVFDEDVGMSERLSVAHWRALPRLHRWIARVLYRLRRLL